jgi:hypothetical protein
VIGFTAYGRRKPNKHKKNMSKGNIMFSCEFSFFCFGAHSTLCLKQWAVPGKLSCVSPYYYFVCEVLDIDIAVFSDKG